MMPESNRMEALVRTDPMALLPFTHVLALKMMGAVVALLGVVAAADYFFQYRTWFAKQKMSLQELKEEFKQTEGDLTIKGKLRNLRMQRVAQAHDVGGAEGLGHHHQPDPLCHRADNTSAAWTLRSASPRAWTPSP